MMLSTPKKLNSFAWPLVSGLSLLLGGFRVWNRGFEADFSGHPLLMSISFVGCAGMAMLYKKLGGRENTLIHGYLMMGGSLAALIAWYIVYAYKRKSVLASRHAQLGALSIIGYLAVGMAGSIFLHPDFGIVKNNPQLMKYNAQIRLVHKYLGRLFTCIAWYVLYLGVSDYSTKSRADKMGLPARCCVILLLSLLGYVTILDKPPVKIF